MKLHRKGENRICVSCHIYNAKGIEYREREDYAFLALPGVDVFVHNQEALDKLRKVLREKEDTCGPGQDRCTGGRDGLDPVTPCAKHEAES